MNGDSPARGMVPERVLDVVAAAERTALAWERTGFGLVGVGALIVHDSRSASSPGPLVLGVAVMVLGAATSVVLAPRRYRRITSDVRAGDTPVLGRSAWLVAIVVGLVAVTAAGLLQP